MWIDPTQKVIPSERCLSAARNVYIIPEEWTWGGGTLLGPSEIIQSRGCYREGPITDLAAHGTGAGCLQWTPRRRHLMLKIPAACPQLHSSNNSSLFPSICQLRVSRLHKLSRSQIKRGSWEIWFCAFLPRCRRWRW